MRSSNASGEEPSDTPNTKCPQDEEHEHLHDADHEARGELPEQDAREAAGRDQQARERSPVALVVHAHRGAEDDRQQHEHEREARHPLLEDGDREPVAGEVLLAQRDLLLGERIGERRRLLVHEEQEDLHAPGGRSPRAGSVSSRISLDRPWRYCLLSFGGKTIAAAASFVSRTRSLGLGAGHLAHVGVLARAA